MMTKMREYIILTETLIRHNKDQEIYKNSRRISF